MDAVDLEPVDLFFALSEEDRVSIAEAMREEKHPRGTLLVEEGDVPSKFYVLLEGHVTVHREGRHIADLDPGDFFGEIGVLSLERRNATVISTTPIRAAVAMGWDLRRLLDEIPAARERLVETAASRSPAG